MPLSHPDPVKEFEKNLYIYIRSFFWGGGGCTFVVRRILFTVVLNKMKKKNNPKIPQSKQLQNQTSKPITHKYITADVSGLVQTL